MTDAKPTLTLFGSCFRQPYTQEVDDLEEAVLAAATAIGWNLWHPKEVRDRDGKLVMGEDELWEKAWALDL